MEKSEKETRGIYNNHQRPQCDVCNNLSPYGHKMSGNFLNTWLTLTNDERFSSCAKHDCPFCALVIRVLKHYLGDTWESEYCCIYIKPGWPVIIRAFGLGRIGGYGNTTFIELFRDDDISGWPQVPYIGRGAKLFKNANDQGVYDFIRKCLKMCHSTHLECQRPTTVPLPTRLLEISGPKCGCKLIETLPGQLGTYTTLSYCWGNGNPLKTFRRVYDSHRNGIPWTRLPRLFQDVIEITYRLGIKHVWIDSLCIIQDDLKDWQIQSEAMASIYSNSYLTIVAASSNGPEMPILKERSGINEPTAFQLVESDGSTSYLYSRPIIMQDAFHANRHVPKHITGRRWTEKIYTRGWAFQEDLLSTRAIHYLSTKVVWECKRMHVDERQLPRGQGSFESPRIDKSINYLDDQSHYYWEQRSEWWEHVEAYTARNLTYITDKLPAISGVASIHSIQTGDRYLAGLWESHLIGDLCWEHVLNRHPISRKGMNKPPNEYLAPSWSWASLGCGEKVNMDLFKTMTPLASTIDIGLTLKGENRFGEVSDGFVKLRGPFFEMDLTRGTHKVNWWTEPEWFVFLPRWQPEGKKTSFAFTLDTALCVGQGRLETGEVVPTMRRGMQEEPVPGGEADSKFPTVHVVILGEVWYDYTYTGLVLGRSFRVPGAYERLGRVVFHQSDLGPFLSENTYSTITIV